MKIAFLFLAAAAVKPIDGDYLAKLSQAAPATVARRALVKSLADTCLSNAALDAQQGYWEYRCDLSDDKAFRGFAATRSDIRQQVTHYLTYESHVSTRIVKDAEGHDYGNMLVLSWGQP